MRLFDLIQVAQRVQSVLLQCGFVCLGNRAGGHAACNRRCGATRIDVVRAPGAHTTPPHHGYHKVTATEPVQHEASSQTDRSRDSCGGVRWRSSFGGRESFLSELSKVTVGAFPNVVYSVQEYKDSFPSSGNTMVAWYIPGTSVFPIHVSARAVDYATVQ